MHHSSECTAAPTPSANNLFQAVVAVCALTEAQYPHFGIDKETFADENSLHRYTLKVGGVRSFFVLALLYPKMEIYHSVGLSQIVFCDRGLVCSLLPGTGLASYRLPL